MKQIICTDCGELKNHSGLGKCSKCYQKYKYHNDSVYRERVLKQNKESIERCNERVKQNKSDYYKKNKKRLKEYYKEYINKNKESISKKRKKYWEDNIEKNRERCLKNYYDNRVERLQKVKIWQKNNIEIHRKANAKYHQKIKNKNYKSYLLRRQIYRKLGVWLNLDYLSNNYYEVNEQWKKINI